MASKTFSLPASDGVNLHVNSWIPEQSVTLRGVVQIAHGMAEHSARYGEFARALNKAGFAVYANDHRGHGRTAIDMEKLGFFAENDGWNAVVNDLRTVTNHIRKEHPQAPIFLMGHSMGSFLMLNYAELHGNEVQGLILSGTAGHPGFIAKVGISLSNIEASLRGKRTPSNFMNFLSFGAFNRPFRPNRTAFDWLSRDNNQVDAYIADPYCGFVCSSSLFADVLGGLLFIFDPKNIARLPKNLPIYIFAGEKDPVGKNTKDIQNTIAEMKKCGIADLEYKFYADARHETINETNRQEVYANVLQWLEKRTK